MCIRIFTLLSRYFSRGVKFIELIRLYKIKRDLKINKLPNLLYIDTGLLLESTIETQFV